MEVGRTAQSIRNISTMPGYKFKYQQSQQKEKHKFKVANEPQIKKKIPIGLIYRDFPKIKIMTQNEIVRRDTNPFN